MHNAYSMARLTNRIIAGRCAVTLAVLVWLGFGVTRSSAVQQLNLASTGTASQSASLNWPESGPNPWTADRALDGKIPSQHPTHPSDGCSGAEAATGHPWAWWRLDLGATYNIARVDVVGGPVDPPVQLRGFRLYVLDSATTMPIDQSGLVYTNEETREVFNNKTGRFNITLTPLKVGRYVFIDIPKMFTSTLGNIVKLPLVLCEVQVYTECGDGTFGLDCNGTCHCSRLGGTCNKVSGKCPGGCEAGYYGDTCENECGDETFGLDCNGTCHCSRLGGMCNKVSGKCPGGCEAGYYGDTCENECKHGTFGINCNSICHCSTMDETCNKSSGICPGACEAGYQGSTCEHECKDGTFGINCNSICHCSTMDETCNKSSGICPAACEAGYQGSTCEHECKHGTFGINCNSICHCSTMDGTCNKSSGICPAACEAGYQGSTCEHVCTNKTYGINCKHTCGHCLNGEQCHTRTGKCSSGCESLYNGIGCIKYEPPESDDGTPAGAIGGAVGGVIVLVAAAVVAIVILKRRRRKAGYKDAPTPMYDEIAETNVDSSHKPHIHSSKQGPKAKSKHGQVNQVVNVIDEIPDITYYEFAEIDDAIKLYHLYDYIHKEKQNKWESLYAEFNTLKGGLGYGYEISQREENRGKSRYREMCAYDHSRVHLEVNEPGETDYINACHIDGYEKVKKFIASQGPTQNMVEDFWRMVLQQKAEIIVILVNVIEMGQQNYMQYWPDKTAIQFGRITIKQIKSLNYPDFSIRTLEVEQKQKEGHRVTQLHFKAWPDKGVPDNARSLVNFWRGVSKTVASTTAPVIVHCSAGVGPTGTFIALDKLYTMARTEGVVRPLSVVEGLRRQRVNMVQTKEQYVYLHEVVAEALCVGTQSVPTSQFEEAYRFMKEELDSETHRPILAMQYDLIQKSLAQSHNSEVDSEPGYVNVTAEIDAERRELVLGPVATGQTIGAVYLPPICSPALHLTTITNCISWNHRGSSICIAAQSPSKATLEEFWTLIAQNNIKTVVMLTSQSDESYSLSHNLGTKDTTNIGPYVVNILNERQFSCFQEVCFTFRKREQRNDALRTVKQFVLLGWRDGDVVPVDPQSVLDMLDAVERWQPHVSEGQPVLAHCRTGAERSGLWCLLMCEQQRMKLDRTVNILGTVKNMKTRNSKLIPNYEQYKFCHDVILMIVADAGCYKNI